jgi:two-component system cell cycle response regulator
MLERQLDELKLTGNLPSPTGVGLSILRLTQSEDYSIGEITKVIRSDPALAGRIIKLANGATKSGLQVVTTADEASMRLGVRTVRNLALGFTLVSSHRSGHCAGFDYEAYWATSLGVGVCAQVLASELRLALPADAFSCGLLSNLGSLALASIHPERYSALLGRAADGGPHRLIDLEREELDLDHRELCGAMLRDWKLPESFAFAAESYELRRVPADAPSDAARNMTNLIRASWKLVGVFLSSRDDEPVKSAAALDALRVELGIAVPAFEQLCELALKSWEEWGELLRIPTETCFDEKEILNRAEWAQSHPGKSRDDEDESPRKGLRILAVDDDPVSLRLLEHHLIRDGHAVLKAVNGKEALEMAMRGDPQMVVTDWNMPEMDGLELCKALRSTPNGRGKYILLLTGREEEDRVVEGFDAGANDYVVKPFNPKILLARVRAGQRMIELR